MKKILVLLLTTIGCNAATKKLPFEQLLTIENNTPHGHDQNGVALLG